jgi:hypothetical protein
MGSKPGLRIDRSETNSLSHGKAWNSNISWTVVKESYRTAQQAYAVS